MSARILETYLEDLDYNKAFLTQGDVNRLSAQYGVNIGERVLVGDLGPAKAIYDIFKARVEERIAKVHRLLTASLIWTAERNGGRRTSMSPTPSGLTGSRVSFCRKSSTNSRPPARGLKSWLGDTTGS
jgi:hypothetical protein